MHVLLLNWYEGPQVALHLLQGPQLLQRLVTMFKKTILESLWFEDEI